MSFDGRTIVVTPARTREERAAPGAYIPTGYRATNRPDVGYGTAASAAVATERQQRLAKAGSPEPAFSSAEVWGD